MVSQDKTLQCVDCGVQFNFSADEQEFFRTKGYTNEPKRCPACRETRRSQRSTQDGSVASQPRRQMFPAVCAECGKTLRYPSSRAGTDRCTAAIATPRSDSNRPDKECSPLVSRSN